eukprot:364282-Chlamydomonas_euryale.AAC.23
MAAAPRASRNGSSFSRCFLEDAPVDRDRLAVPVCLRRVQLSMHAHSCSDLRTIRTPPVHARTSSNANSDAGVAVHPMRRRLSKTRATSTNGAPIGLMCSDRRHVRGPS